MTVFWAWGIEAITEGSTEASKLVKGNNPINGVECFWSFAKRRLMKPHEVPQTALYLNLKQCKFLFNCRREDIYKMVLKDSQRISPLIVKTIFEF